jgi:hypothetical protein
LTVACNRSSVEATWDGDLPNVLLSISIRAWDHVKILLATAVGRRGSAVGYFDPAQSIGKAVAFNYRSPRAKPFVQ